MLVDTLLHSWILRCPNYSNLLKQTLWIMANPHPAPWIHGVPASTSPPGTVAAATAASPSQPNPINPMRLATTQLLLGAHNCSSRQLAIPWVGHPFSLLTAHT